MDRLDGNEARVAGVLLGTSVVGLLTLTTLSELDSHLQNAVYVFVGQIPVLAVLWFVGSSSRLVERMGKSRVGDKAWACGLLLGFLGTAMAMFSIVAHFGNWFVWTFLGGTVAAVVLLGLMGTLDESETTDKSPLD